MEHERRKTERRGSHPVNESLLRQIPLFAALEPDEIRQLADRTRPVNLSPGAFLFHEGECGDKFFAILEGEIEIIQAIGTPDERLLKVRGVGEFLGEMSLFDRQSLRSASGRARTPVTVLEITHASFDALLHQSPDLAYEVVRELTLRLREDDASAISDLQEKNRRLAEAYAALEAAQAQIIEKEKLERELQVARRIQQSMLPSALPEMPGYSFGACMVPARAVGGDLFDFIPLDADALGIVIGDVSDKGVPAALFMALVRSLLRAEAGRDRPPADVLRRVNTLLLDMNDAGMFVTLIYGVLDRETHRFSYARAGHEIPLVYDERGERIPATRGVGQMLGVFPDVLIDEQTVAIPTGGALLMYSDGATDIENPARERLGFDRLEPVVRASLGGDAQTVCDRVLAALQFYQSGAPQADDVTLVGVKAG